MIAKNKPDGISERRLPFKVLLFLATGHVKNLRDARGRQGAHFQKCRTVLATESREWHRFIVIHLLRGHRPLRRFCECPPGAGSTRPFLQLTASVRIWLPAVGKLTSLIIGGTWALVPAWTPIATKGLRYGVGHKV